MIKRKAILSVMVAALVVLSAAICAVAQKNTGAVKQNQRELRAPAENIPVDAKKTPEDITYGYEFKKSEFTIRHITIEHDARGHGQITFERQGDLESIVEPFELSESALTRIRALWDALHFLNSTTDYQATKQFPHLGTMKLKMSQGARRRDAEFNWTQNTSAKALADEYRRAANQFIFIFDMSVARQNQPLDSPKLLDRLDIYLKRGELSDSQQLIPLLRDLTTDERLPLMARNHAARILKKIED